MRRFIQIVSLNASSGLNAVPQLLPHCMPRGDVDSMVYMIPHLVLYSTQSMNMLVWNSILPFRRQLTNCFHLLSHTLCTAATIVLLSSFQLNSSNRTPMRQSLVHTILQDSGGSYPSCRGCYRTECYQGWLSFECLDQPLWSHTHPRYLFAPTFLSCSVTCISAGCAYMLLLV
jgi:hypothetical protein